MTKETLSAAPDQRIPLRYVVALLLSDGIITQDSATLTERLISDSDCAGAGCLATIGAKRWKHATDQNVALDVDFLCSWFAKRQGLRYVPINPVTLNNTLVVSSLSDRAAKKYLAVVVEVSSSSVTVATAEPYDTNLDLELSATYPDHTIIKQLCSGDQINQYISQVYDFRDSLNVASSLALGNSPSTISNLEQLLALSKNTLKDEDQAIVSLVDWLLQHALSLKASDIHLEPHRTTCSVRFRIDGTLHPIQELPGNVSAPIISRLKVLSRMDVAEKRKPQDGRIKIIATNKSEVEFRISTMPVAFGEKMVLRIFDPEVLTLGLDSIGLSKKNLAQWRQLIGNENGMILVCGPTGSGKTTMLYTSLKSLASAQVNVSTIEDPIELIDDRFNQMQVQSKIGLNFAVGIRTLLRQDPDIIMVGEIRDPETAQTAAQASLTGHLVLSTLHTNDSLTAITRLRDLDLPSYLITNTLRGVLAMRLVRKLCPHCKQASRTIPDPEWEEFTRPYRIKKPEAFFTAPGCKKCRGAGFSGRVALYEMLTINQTMRSLIYRDATIDELNQAAIEQGVTPLRIAGAKLIVAGITTLEEVAHATPENYLPA